MRTITRVLSLAAFVLASLAIVPATSAQQPDVVYTTTALNLRSGPTMRSERLLTMPPDAITYLVACESSAWCQVEYVTPRGFMVTGYAHGGYLSFVPAQARAPRHAYPSGAVFGAPRHTEDKVVYHTEQPGYREIRPVRYDAVRETQPVYYDAPKGNVLAEYVAVRTSAPQAGSAQGVYDASGVWHPMGAPRMPMAECKDGTYDDGTARRSTCATRGGVLRWIR